MSLDFKTRCPRDGGRTAERGLTGQLGSLLHLAEIIRRNRFLILESHNKPHLEIQLENTAVISNNNHRDVGGASSRPHIGHEHGGAQPAGLQGVDDVRRDVGVVGDGGRDVHPGRAHVRPTAARLASADALQHAPSVLPVGVLGDETVSRHTATTRLHF
ncbi:hypothetical protein EYF80_046679 [Liparis tanakae]|uniref:Uncharacterized protein n=1 Tax=Liparis tanakae TaxID=230148 RepID=A0A4Z2FPJ5_9TELE|nr:hypothetical protein EYF80_046679 [Liparis tanakae]